jgi:hypothetical protein
MTKRQCPWCGGQNLHIVNVGGNDPKHGNSSCCYWEDRDCGYREKTTGSEYYNYSESKFIPIDPPYQIIEFHKPSPPLPVHQQPEYLRNGIKTTEAPQGQQSLFGEKVPA